MARTCHLAGAAGVGMSSLAQALLAEGWTVTGSDRYLDSGQDLEVITKLRLAGVTFFPQDGSGVRANTAVLGVSTAVEPGNPDLEAAARLGIPVRHRSELLAELMDGKEGIAITGTSGKTTVTGMVGWILSELGADPSVVNGGALVNWASDRAIGNFRHGRSGRWVIEADESDRSLLRYHPHWALITNMSADHFSLEETATLFDTFRRQVTRESIAGWDPGMPWQNLQPALAADGVRFRYESLDFHLPLLGAHNAENALQAAVLCHHMGFPLPAIRDALSRFRGIQRRLEHVGTARGITVIDEYAHNPAKIAAAWKAVEPYYRRVFAVWRPHGFGPMKNMFDDLAATFQSLARPPHQLLLLPVYYVGGTANATVTTDTLAERLRAANAAVKSVADYGELDRHLRRELQEGDVVLIMGARDPGLPAYARTLVHELTAP